MISGTWMKNIKLKSEKNTLNLTQGLSFTDLKEELISRDNTQKKLNYSLRFWSSFLLLMKNNTIISKKKITKRKLDWILKNQNIIDKSDIFFIRFNNHRMETSVL